MMASQNVWATHNETVTDRYVQTAWKKVPRRLSSTSITIRSKDRGFRSAVYYVLKSNGSSMAVQEIIAILLRITPNIRPATRVENSVRTLLSRESHKRRGAFVRTARGQYDLRERIETRLREKIRSEIQSQGLRFGANGSLVTPTTMSKEFLRAIHARARASKYSVMRDFIARSEPHLIEYFADGTEIDIDAFTPRVEVVESGTWQSNLFRYATLLWSVPVSEGFGRRVRFLVWDNSNGFLVGLFALGDPVFNLRCRDQWIGWGAKQREERLYNVMDIFVLGAVPPYNELLGGKLVAMLAASNEVRRMVERRYQDKPTVLKKEKKNPRLVLLTTGSALGKSSLYDRIKFNELLLYKRIGTSQGWGHFHLNGGLFEEMKAYVAISDPERAYANRFGNGPNWKIRVARQCLEGIGLPSDLLRHGISREIYAVPLASNLRQFLTGQHQRVRSFDLPFDALSTHFKDRWMRGRALRRPEYKDFRKEAVSRAIHSAESIT